MRYMELAAQDMVPDAGNCGLTKKVGSWSSDDENRLRMDIAWKLRCGVDGVTARCAIVVDDEHDFAVSEVHPRTPDFADGNPFADRSRQCEI